jgi:heme-degrading monooxygenase HmoA
MPLVSVTRFRPRSLLSMPEFTFHAARSMAQVRKAEGWLAGAVKRDGDQAFWTLTVWRDEAAMLAYVISGPHGVALPRLREIAVEASMVRWVAETDALPDWSEGVRRMRHEGRASRLKRPGPNHEGLSYPDSAESFGSRL